MGGTGLDKVDSGKDGVVQTERMGEYSVCHIRNEVNMRRVPRVFGCCAYGCQKCSKYRGICKRPNEDGLRGVRRQRFLRGVIKEVRNVMMDTFAEIPEVPDDADNTHVSSTIILGDLECSDDLNSTL